MVTSRTIISCAKQTTMSVVHRRLTGTGVEEETRFMQLPPGRGVERELNWRPPPKYLEAASGTIRRLPPFVKRNVHEHHRSLAGDTSRATEARRCTPQLRESAHCSPGCICRGRG